MQYLLINNMKYMILKIDIFLNNYNYLFILLKYKKYAQSVD